MKLKPIVKINKVDTIAEIPISGLNVGDVLNKINSVYDENYSRYENIWFGSTTSHIHNIKMLGLRKETDVEYEKRKMKIIKARRQRRIEKIKASCHSL